MLGHLYFKEEIIQEKWLGRARTLPFRARALPFRARANSGLGSIQELRARTLQKARKNVSGGLGLGLEPRPVPPLIINYVFTDVTKLKVDLTVQKYLEMKESFFSLMT